MSHNRRFNHQYETIGASRVPKGVGDRYYAQDLARDHRYLQGLAGRLFLNSLGVTSALISGGLVTQGSSVTKVNVTAAKGVADFDVEVTKESDGWAVPASTETNQIPMMIEMVAQTDFDISGATLDGSTPNYLKLRYAEANVQTRVKQFSSGSYNYSIGDSYVLVADAVAPTTKDVILATFIGNGTSTLIITQLYPVGPAGQQMAECADNGFTYDGSDAYLGQKLKIASRDVPGATVFSSFKITPTAFGSAKSSAHPSYPDYAPYIDRSTDQDVSTANFPKLAALRNVKASIKGTTDFTVTVTGSNVVFANDAPGIAAVQKIVDDAIVSGWLNTNQTIDAPADYTTAASQVYLNINGIDYPITSGTIATRTVVVSGTPASGAQTAIMYPFRASGATTVRFRKLTGFVPIVDGDADGENVNGFRKMDRFLRHRHGLSGATSSLLGVNGPTAANIRADSSAYNQGVTISDPTASTLGAVRDGKTNDPRGFGQYVYTFTGSYI